MSETLSILVVDDDRRMAKTLVDILKLNGYQAEPAHSGLEALDKVKADGERAEKRFDCILTDIKMPEMDGVELSRAIKAVRPEVAVVLMTAYATNALVRKGLEEGAIAALAKPLDMNVLLSFLAALRKERSIVVVDDDPAFRKTIGDILAARGFAVIEVPNPHDWEEHLKEDGQIVLLDMKLNGIGGLEILKQIREKHPHLPVILLTGYREEMASAIETALEIDAYICLYKPFDIEELLQLLTEVHHQDVGRLLGQPVRKRR